MKKDYDLPTLINITEVSDMCEFLSEYGALDNSIVPFVEDSTFLSEFHDSKPFAHPIRYPSLGEMDKENENKYGHLLVLNI